MSAVDSLMYPLAHRTISLAFGALCISSLTTLESVHDTWLSPGRSHHRCWLASAQAAPAATSAAPHRHACAHAWPARQGRLPLLLATAPLLLTCRRGWLAQHAEAQAMSSCRRECDVSRPCAIALAACCPHWRTGHLAG